MTRLPAAVTRGYLVIACAAMVITVGVHLATFGPPAWIAAVTAIWPILFAGVFVLYTYVILVVSFGRMRLDVLITDMPLAVKVGFGVVMLYAIANFGIAFRTLQGAHEQDPVFMARLFTGHALVFYAASAALGYEIDRVRRGLLDLSRGPRDDGLERSPLPAPLSRSMVLQTQLSPADCTARLTRWRGLRGNASTDVFRFDLAGPRSSMVYAVGRFEGTSPTFIRLLLTFKRFYLVLIGSTVLLLPLVAWMFGGVGFAWQGVLFVIVFAGGGNIVYGIVQMRRLEGQIRKATESQRVSIG